MTFANLLTFSRVLLIVPVIYLTSIQLPIYDFFALILFLVAAITDYFDGYIARRMGNESKIGALLDLLADKLLVCLTLVWLISLNSSFLFIMPVMIIIFRELVISSIRQFIVEKRGKNELTVTFVGKSKTTFQLLSISLIIISPSLGDEFLNFALFMLWIASCFSIFSLFDYVSEWRKLFY